MILSSIEADVQRQWNEKHMQRLQELEEEEKAAENQDMPEDAQEPYPEQAAQRPMRAIRAPRLNSALERSDILPRSSRDTEGGSPQTPVRRAGRGELSPRHRVCILDRNSRLQDLLSPCHCTSRTP